MWTRACVLLWTLRCSYSLVLPVSVENLYGALKNIDRSDIVKSLEIQAPQAGPECMEEGASRLTDRDSTLLSPSVINGKSGPHLPTTQLDTLFQSSCRVVGRTFCTVIFLRRSFRTYTHSLSHVICHRERNSHIGHVTPQIIILYQTNYGLIAFQYLLVSKWLSDEDSTNF